MNKKFFVFFIFSIIAIGILIFFLFFNDKTAKNFKMGNTSSSQEIVDKILNILNQIDELKTVIYDQDFSANVHIDRKPTPGALIYCLPDWNLNIKTGLTKESADFQIFFFTPTQLDIKAEDKLSDIENMYQITRDFLSKLLKDNTIRVIDDNVVIKATYGKFDKFVCGVSLQIKIEQKQGYCI